MNNLHNKEVFIFAAGSIKNNIEYVQYRFNSPALLPINSINLASLLLDFYLTNHKDWKINFVINENDIDDISNELKKYLNKIKIISISDTKGINESIKKVFSNVNSNIDCIVNLVTTVPTSIPEKNQVFLSKDLFTNEFFSLISTHKNICFYKKGGKKKRKDNAFTGIFRTSSSEIIKASSVVKKQNDLLCIVEEIYKSQKLSFKTIDWIDCGHDKNYKKSKSMMLSSRSFNSIDINDDLGILLKKSTKTEKFKNEINFINSLPSKLKNYFPKVISENHNLNSSTAELEYFPYPVLSEYMLYWDIEDEVWENVFKNLKDILSNFKKNKNFISVEDFESFYLDKINQRLDDFSNQLDEKDKFLLNDDKLVINGKTLKNYNILQNQVKLKIQSMYSENDFCIMHGDYCFSNIIFNHKDGIVKLIDPRGSFGSKIGIYGDIKYDLAKIAHSTFGQYDYFISRLYELEIIENKINYSVQKRSNHKLLENLTIQLIDSTGFKHQDIFFIVSLLFISMCSLHDEDYQRQKAFYIHGIKLLNNYLT